MKTSDVSAPGGTAVRTGAIWQAVLVAALGYFVDIYDLVLFSIVRVESLRGIGIPEAELLDRGVLLINMQMGGMLLGGLLWGILGDKRGRLSILVASIATYSLANLANGFVQNLGQYVVVRFVAGVGLAGELGAGVTLVSELMSKEARGYGTTIIASVGLLGAVVAALLGDELPWRQSYIVGGVLGLGLLVLRIGVRESGMFERVKQQPVTKGNFLTLLKPPHFGRYLCLILVGVPGWYIMGILVTFAPELTRAMGMSELPRVSTASTTAPNFVRGAVVPMTFLFRFAASYLGVVAGAAVVGFLVVTAALLAVRYLTETYGKDLNYVDV